MYSFYLCLPRSQHFLCPAFACFRLQSTLLYSAPLLCFLPYLQLGTFWILGRMFYSHQILAKKAPLGQIWMAATLHAKMNRRKLAKINILKVCEEILNPTVPMALRLSGILMGGVVIVYEKKVKLLYDDVTRLLVEINEAWKMRAVGDPTVLPKGKTQAKFEAVTLPENELLMEEPATVSFQRTTYFPMELDNIDEAYININPGDDDVSHHQADKANITLLDDFISVQAETDWYRFERFDIEGEEEDVAPLDPATLVPTPQPQEEPPQDNDDIHQQQESTPEDQHTDEHFNEVHEDKQDEQRKQPTKRKGRAKATSVAMDHEQTIIPGPLYQSWLKDTCDIYSKRGRKLKRPNPMGFLKINSLMELPPVVLNCGLANAMGEVHYPMALLEIWRKCTQGETTHHQSSSTRSAPQMVEPSYHSPPEPPQFPVEDFHSGIGYQQVPPPETLRADLDNIQLAFDHTVLTTGSSGYSARSFPGSVHSDGVRMDSDIQLTPGRSSSKRHHSSSRHSSFGALDPVDEEPQIFVKLRRLSENGPTPEELLEETGPTQTPKPASDPALNEISRSIKTHLKLHFDAPGAPQVESLNQLASGMNRRRAAQLFYQTCLLASVDILKVEQPLAYGDILISRGPKM